MCTERDPEHTSTLLTVNNLGKLCADQSKLTEAEKMYQWALEGKEKALSPEPTSTLDTVKNLGDPFVNQGGDQYGNALQAASARGYKKVVQMLLDNGADINAQGGHHGNALQAASYGGHERVLNLLLNRGADINSEEMQTALPFKNNEKVTPFLPGQDTDVNTQSEQHDNALQAASHKGKMRATLQEGTESNLISDKTMDVPISRATQDDSSESGCEIMSDEDEDFAIDGSTLPEYDSPLASLRHRISEPVDYFDRLSILAHLIYQHSTLQTYSKSYTPRTLAENANCLEPFPKFPKSLEKLTLDGFEPIKDSDVIRICQDVCLTHNGFTNELLEILECRNVIAQTYSNLKRLQFDGFCLQKFSTLTIDPYRQDVARLLPIDIQQILQLLTEIDSVLRRIADFARRPPPTTSSVEVLLNQALEEQDNLLLSVPRCTTFLTTFGLNLASPDTIATFWISTVLRLVVHTTDLAVASYAGAHLSRFDEEYLREQLDAIDVLSPFTSLHKSQIPSLKLNRCRLQCLDSFHKSQSVWVFSSSDWKPRGHLFLSTKIEDFADIWGPLWKVVDHERHDTCTRYAVGNGYIYKWKSQEATPRLLENETLCHWVSSSSIEAGPDYSLDTEKPVFPDIVDEAFDSNETLLIGAVAAGCERLTTCRRCNLDLEERRSALDDIGRVQMLGTLKEHTYKDSETYQLQAGHSSINASVSKQYKRRGQSLKQAFVEAWTTTPELREPRLLQHFYGLEISLCTQNAQRIQLGRILGLDSMCQYLRSFRWKTDSAKQAYFDALRGFRKDSDALHHAWESHNQYQEDFGRAVLVCLKALEKTGINYKGQLSTFWCSEVTARPELIAMEPKEHSWIGLLKDSENSCCMAAIGDECLEFRQEFGGSICGRSGRSCLRTALVINRLNKPHGTCRKKYNHKTTDGWTSRWSVSGMEISSDVWLGKHGTLRLLSHIRDGTLLMDWRATPFTTAVKSFLDKEKPHREYSENIQKEVRRIRPIPLFVMSNPEKAV